VRVAVGAGVSVEVGGGDGVGVDVGGPVGVGVNAVRVDVARALAVGVGTGGLTVDVGRVVPVEVGGGSVALADAVDDGVGVAVGGAPEPSSLPQPVVNAASSRMAPARAVLFPLSQCGIVRILPRQFRPTQTTASCRANAKRGGRVVRRGGWSGVRPRPSGLD
jgi:hypothetical protein